MVSRGPRLKGRGLRTEETMIQRLPYVTRCYYCKGPIFGFIYRVIGKFAFHDDICIDLYKNSIWLEKRRARLEWAKERIRKAFGYD